MDTCCLERVERFRINLNEKSFVSQPVFCKDAEPLAPAAAATNRLSIDPTSVLMRKGHRIRVAPAGADASLFERYPAEGTRKVTVSCEAQWASCLDPPVKTHDP